MKRLSSIKIKYEEIRMKSFLTFLLSGFLVFNVLTFISCSDMLESDSTRQLFDKELNQKTDSVFFAYGVMQAMQQLADQYVFQGEMQGDLVNTTYYTDNNLRQLWNFSANSANRYDSAYVYYRVINNCNYFIENADTALYRLGTQVFEKEFAAVKTYRAWTYLQLVKNYGEVPLVLKPALTEAEARAEMNKPYSDINAICNYFIEDIKPYVNTNLPQYGDINQLNSQKFFIPVRVLLGELCLWAGKYDEAAHYLYDYLTLKDHQVYS